jgi:hypothetical protein
MKGHTMITQSKLKELLNYDQDTGIFTWKKRTSNRIKVGNIAGNTHNCGYIEMCIEGKRCLAHRLAWLYIYGYLPKLIDHINGDRQDNKISNLREATYQTNIYNSKIRSDNKSGVRCVSWNNKRNSWEVRIKIDGKLKHYGDYKDLNDAKKVADRIRSENHKEFYK